MSVPPRSALEDFLYAEAALLDGGAFGAWLDLFTTDGIYWVPASPNQTDAENEISLFHENVALMRMRIERLGHPRAHGVALPIRTSRIVGNVVAGGIDAGEIVVGSRFQLVEFQDRRQRLFAGTYTHRLVPEGGSFRIRQKRVDLVNVEGWHEAMQVFL